MAPPPPYAGIDGFGDGAFGYPGIGAGAPPKPGMGGLGDGAWGYPAIVCPGWPGKPIAGYCCWGIVPPGCG